MTMGVPEVVISLAVILIVLYAFYKIMKILVYNTVAGLVLLFVLNATVFAGNPIEITFWKVVLTAVAGVIGAVFIAGAHYLGLLGI